MDVTKIKKLRSDTGAGVMEAKQVLEKFGNDLEEATKYLMSKVSEKAAKKLDRTTKDGLVHSYIHNKGKVGSLVLLACETDFVAKTEDFKKLANDIAMQICTDEYENVESLLKSEYMRDSSRTVQDCINGVIAKVGEKVELKDFVKYSV